MKAGSGAHVGVGAPVDPFARLLARSTRQGICALDREGRVTYADDGMARMLGHRRGEMEGRPLDDFAAGDVRHVVRDMLRRERMGADAIELALCHASGRHVWVVIDSMPAAPPHDGLPGALAVVTDVTDRKHAELRLSATEQFAQAISETTADGVVAIDNHGAIAFVNSAGERALGWTENELVGRKMHDVLHFQTRDGRGFPARRCPVRATLLEGRTIDVEDDAFTRKDGHLLPVSYSASPLIRGGELSGAVVAFRDRREWLAEEQRARDEHESALWLERIRAALDEDRFVLYGQPIFDIRTGAHAQTEVLLRLRERDGRIVGPASFLPVAERSGLIRDIDLWVIGQAARLAASGMRVQVNVSARSLGPTLAMAVEEALSDAGAEPHRLIFELTETALMEHPSDGARFARRLTELGCGFALDDFGTGYGGFTYLKRLPVQQLKIDIEFVRQLISDVANQHVVRAVVGLAQGLGHYTVAEGVEDRATLDLLRRYSVDYAQGFYLARPAEIVPAGSPPTRR